MKKPRRGASSVASATASIFNHLPERTTKSTAQGFYSQRCTLRPEATAPLISASSFTRRFEL
ncbi:MAG: hypothetical protein LAP86_06845 [Acidobacteriia bacterium]|nr:hypothetical protein [Terriglobia bacterium]